MPRVDLFTTIHKALRVALFEAALEVGRADLREADDAGPVVARVRSLLDLLDEHAAHEDDLLLPVVAAAAPLLASDLAGEHVRLAGLRVDLRRLLVRLEQADGPERAALGARLHVKMGSLVAVHLTNMEREEGGVNRILWAHVSDAELLALRARIQARLTPERLGEWMALLVSAATPGERAEVLAALARGRSEAELAVATGSARRALGERRWAAVRAAAAAAGSANGARRANGAGPRDLAAAEMLP